LPTAGSLRYSGNEFQTDGPATEQARRAKELSRNPMDPDTHVTGSLLNIWSGQVAQPNVNVDGALDMGLSK